MKKNELCRKCHLAAKADYNFCLFLLPDKILPLAGFLYSFCLISLLIAQLHFVFKGSLNAALSTSNIYGKWKSETAENIGRTSFFFSIPLFLSTLTYKKSTND